MPATAMTQTTNETFTFGNISAMMIVMFFFVLLIALLLIFRDLICWYFKINQVVRTQEEIKAILKELKEKTAKQNSPHILFAKLFNTNC